jgi:hypothetical protein
MPVRFDPFPPHVDHVIAKKHGGRTHSANLAFTCAHCNGHKGTDIAGIDPVTRILAPLYNPRAERWTDHFRWDGPLLVGETPTARATIRVLAINAGRRIAVRTQLMAEGAY